MTASPAEASSFVRDPALLEEFEAFLQKRIETLPLSRLSEAMGYSLLAPGKRIRPLLLFAALNDYQIDPHAGFACAAAVEMIHAYSLIHDDMPEMDNDDLRRGRPTCHKAFGADAALLAGDALQSLAFETLCLNDPRKVPALVSLCARMAGAAGMCYGQDLDLQASERPSLEELETIEAFKTGCLISLPLCMAAVLADQEQDLEKMKLLGTLIGIQFQIQDDLLELTSDAQTMGKSLSDSRNGKATAACVMSFDQSRARIEELDGLIQDHLESLSLQDPKELRSLSAALKKRTH